MSLKEIIAAAILTIFIIGIMLGVVFFKSNQEAKSYRKFCNNPVSAWDALWLDLRIDECKNNPPN